MDGGAGNDTLLSRSDAGEMVAAQDGTTQIFADETAAFKAVNDTLTGGAGADTFRFEGMVNAKDEIVAKHVNDDGTIDWVGVTGENNATHDHWVDGFGNDVIRDFNRAQGDKIEISAHTGEVQSIEHKDSNGDGRNDYSVITVISQQGNAGAHDEDLLGTITVYGNLVKQSDIVADPDRVWRLREGRLTRRRRALRTGGRRRAGRWRNRRRPPQRSDGDGQHAHVSQEQQDTITNKGRLPALVLQRPAPIHSAPGAGLRSAFSTHYVSTQTRRQRPIPISPPSSCSVKRRVDHRLVILTLEAVSTPHLRRTIEQVRAATPELSGFHFASFCARLLS